MLHRHDKGSSGFTLIELVLVIGLLVIIGGFSLSRMDSVIGWKQKGDLRAFANTWEFLFHEALIRQETYRLIADLDRERYFVRREIQVDRGVEQVDYLANLRTKGERERRSKQHEEETMTLEEEFRAADAREAGSLEQIFFAAVYSDPNSSFRLGLPTQLPSLGEGKNLTDGLKFRDVELGEKRLDAGAVHLRISPQGADDFAVVHITLGPDVFTMALNPTTGKVQTLTGDVAFDDVFQNFKKLVE